MRQILYHNSQTGRIDITHETGNLPYLSVKKALMPSPFGLVSGAMREWPGMERTEMLPLLEDRIRKAGEFSCDTEEEAIEIIRIYMSRMIIPAIEMQEG